VLAFETFGQCLRSNRLNYLARDVPCLEALASSIPATATPPQLPPFHTDSLLLPTSGSARASHVSEKIFFLNEPPEDHFRPTYILLAVPHCRCLLIQCAAKVITANSKLKWEK